MRCLKSWPAPRLRLDCNRHRVPCRQSDGAIQASYMGLEVTLQREGWVYIEGEARDVEQHIQPVRAGGRPGP